jgi:outer membrane receptor protein involved in Fe transport
MAEGIAGTSRSATGTRQEGLTIVTNLTWHTRTALRGSVATAALSLAMLIGPSAFAQEVAAAPEEAANDTIIVTGSRIARPDLEQSSPVSVISAQELGRQAPVSVEEVLRLLPGTVPGIGAQVNNGNAGVATFNLRGLGSNRNLVLLNQRRVVPSTLAGEVDLNIIPIALLERVDVFTGGAVTAYGADAVAGVVNFVTRRDFQGVDLTVQSGLTERGDGQQFRISGVVGGNFADGRGNVVVGIDYTKTNPVLQGDRAFSNVSRGSTCPASVSNADCATRETGPEQGSIAASPASLLFPLPPANVGGVPTGNPFAGGARVDPATGSFVPGFSNFNFNPLNLFQTPLDRWSIYAAGQYEITSGVEVYTEAMFTRSTVRTAIAPTSTFFNAFQVPLNNPFLTATQANQLCQFTNLAQAANPSFTQLDCPAAIAAGTEVTAQPSRRFVEGGPRANENISNVFQVTAGVRGKLTDTLNFDVFGQYGEANRRNTSQGGALAARVQQALRVNPATGLCRDTLGGCVPINLFGADGTITPEMLAFIGVPTSTFTNTSFSSVQALVNGDVGFSSPFSDRPIGIAVGAEYRRYAGNQFGDLPSSTPGAILGSGGAFLSFDGSFYSNELFGEINVPIVTERPGFYDLSFDGGIRYADYNNTGGNWTFKAGGTYSPIPDIKIRGAWTRAVRSPGISELFAPENTGLGNRATEPCAGNVTNPTTIALCTAQLQRVGLSAANIGGVPQPAAGQINVTTEGNPQLQPEIATTLTAGVVFQPRNFLSGFSATVDWYRIRVEDAITSPTSSDVIDGCFSAGQTNPNDPRCLLIGRNPLNGGLSGDPATTRGPFLPTTNSGFIETAGVDFTLNYDRTFGDVRFNWFLNGNYTYDQRFQSQPGSIVRECAGLYSAACSAIAPNPVLPRWTWTSRVSVGYDIFDVSLLWQHIGAVEYERRTVPGVVTPLDQTIVGSFGAPAPERIVGAYREIDAWNLFDLNIGVDVSETLRMSFLVQNLFDKDPPVVGNTIGSTAQNSGNTFPSTYDALGRRYTVSLGLRF